MSGLNQVINAVLSTVFIIIFLSVFFPSISKTKSITAGVSNKQLAIAVIAKDSSMINDGCREFYDTYYSVDFAWNDRFGGLFPGSEGDLKYRKLKLFCGAIIAIEDTADRLHTGGNVVHTVNEINEAYSFVYPFLRLDPNIIVNQIGGKNKVEWLGDVENYVHERVDLGVVI